MTNNDLIPLLVSEEFKMPPVIMKIGELCVQRNAKKKDTVIAISGEEGTGKSTLAILIAMAICMVAKLSFTFKDNMIFTAEQDEIRKKLDKLPICSPIIPDEAIKFLYKLNWASKGQKFINVLYALARKKRKITILPIPRFTDVNEFFRNHRVKIWIHIVKEGKAIVFMKDWNIFSFQDPWHIQENEKLINKLRRKRKFSAFSYVERIRMFKQCLNFVTVFNFPPLPDSIYLPYEEMTKDTLDDLEDFFGMGEKKKDKIIYKTAMKNLINELKKRGTDLDTIAILAELKMSEIDKIFEED